jgi:polyisoprenoid-binding protein YceI
MRKFLWPTLLVLSACATAPREEAPPAAPPAPVQPAPAAPVAPGEAWKVVGSHLAVRVYRDGTMKKLGHNHLITSDRLEGEIVLREPVTATSFTLRVPLDSLVVDDEAARVEAGGDFAAPVPAQDAEGTRRNMLGEKLLDAARHPVMTLASESISGEPGSYEAKVRVSIAGSEHVVTAPFTVTIEGDALKAHAAFHLVHADVGLVPFTVALGALKVRDDFEVDLAVEARRGS